MDEQIRKLIHRSVEGIEEVWNENWQIMRAFSSHMTFRNPANASQE